MSAPNWPVDWVCSRMCGDVTRPAVVDGLCDARCVMPDVRRPLKLTALIDVPSVTDGAAPAIGVTCNCPSLGCGPLPAALPSPLAAAAARRSLRLAKMVAAARSKGTDKKHATATSSGSSGSSTIALAEGRHPACVGRTSDRQHAT